MKKRQAWNKNNKIIRIYWEYSALGKVFEEELPQNKELHFNLKKPVKDFFKKYFIITDAQEIDKVESRINGKFLPEKNVSKEMIKDSSDYVKGTLYGIFICGCLVYVGKTTRGLETRWNEHLSFVNDKNLKSGQQKYLYEAIRQNKGNVQCLVLMKGLFKSNRVLEEYEKILIETLKPRFNYEGVKAPYRFTEDKRKKSV